MRRIGFLMLLCITLLALASGVVACKSNSSPTPGDAAVRAYADPATETTLQGLSENSLAKYVQNGNAAFKAAVTQEVFDQTVAQINSQLGAYQSKEFLRTEEQQGYIIVHYKATYANGVFGVRMVFDKDHLVAGQFFEQL
jgi:hypothetical protein